MRERPWERKKGESEQAYEAFDLYLKMGTERGVYKVASQLGKSGTLISRWSVRWDWSERARAYDNELADADLKSKKKEIEAMNARHIKEGRLMQTVAARQFNKLNVDDDGVYVPVKYITAMMTQGASLEREAMLYGMSDENTAGGGSTNGVLESLIEMERELREVER